MSTQETITTLKTALYIARIVLEQGGNLDTKTAANGPTIAEVIDKAIAAGAADLVPTSVSETVPFTEESVKDHLDKCILFWRAQRKDGMVTASQYIDAYQSLRISLFGTTLP